MEWLAIDLETTGLDPHEELICEVGFQRVTTELLGQAAYAQACGGDGQAQLLEDGNHELVREMHTKSGLLEVLQVNQTTMAELEQDALLWLAMQNYKRGEVILLGSSLRLDRNFLDEYMPELSDFFHYRMIDVSTIKELCRNWQPETYARVPVKDTSKDHRVLEDISGTLQELRFYRSFGFIGGAFGD